MRSKAKPNLLIICILEISLGLLALVEIGKVLFFGETSLSSAKDIRWLIPALSACFLYFFLGIIVLHKTRLVRLLHFVFIPVICLVVILGSVLSGITRPYDISFVVLPVLSGIIVLFYIVGNNSGKYL